MPRELPSRIIVERALSHERTLLANLSSRKPRTVDRCHNGFSRAVDISIGNSSIAENANDRSCSFFRKSHCFKDMGDSDLSTGASRSGRQRHFTRQLGAKAVAIDALDRDSGAARHHRVIARDPRKTQLSARQSFEQPADPRRRPGDFASGEVGDSRTGGCSEARDQWNRLGARPDARLLPAAANQRRGGRHTGGYVQRTHAHRAVAFVGREAEVVDVERRDIDDNFACRLRGVGMNIGPHAMGEGSYLFDRLDHPCLVIDEHHRDQQHRLIEQPGHRFEIEATKSVDRRNRDLKSLCSKGGCWLQHRLMFDRRDENPPPRGLRSGRRGDAEQREIVRFGRPGGKDDFRRGGTNQTGNVGPCIGDDSGGTFAGSVRRACVAWLFPDRQHRGARLVRQWQRGESIKINGRRMHISRARARRRGSCYGCAAKEQCEA